MMMKRILFILMIFSFANTQVMAAKCQLNCATQKSIKRPAKKMNMATHKCCHKKKRSENKRKTSCCSDEVRGACFHNLGTEELISKQISETTKKIIFLSELLIRDALKVSPFSNRAPPESSYLEFLKYKANLKLHILKNQFLI